MTTTIPPLSLELRTVGGEFIDQFTVAVDGTPSNTRAGLAAEPCSGCGGCSAAPTPAGLLAGLSALLRTSSRRRQR